MPRTVRYVYDNEDVILEYVRYGDREERTASYLHGPGIDEPLAVERRRPPLFGNGGFETYDYLADGLGSVTGLTDSRGRLVQRYEYDSFGNPMAGNPLIGQPYAFTGREYDPETGLYYYRARYYDPRAGRFITKDPIGFAGGVNLYSCIQNNPVNRIDPLGLFEWVNPIPYWRGVYRGTKDFLRNYRDMRDANTIGADKYFHCIANCQAAREGQGGRDISEIIGEGRELTDEYIKGDTRSACDEDRAANRQGRNGDPGGTCSQVCEPLRPKGLDPRY